MGIWEKENYNLKFNCVCGSRVEKRKTFKLEHLISGNSAYECPSCKMVYDVWSKKNQKRLFIIIIIIILGGLLLFV